MKRRTLPLALLAAVVLLGLVVLGLSGERTSGMGRAELELAGVLEPGRCAFPGTAEELPDVAEPAHDSRAEVAEVTLLPSRPSRATRAVQELARLLASEPFDRAGFERAAQALAAGLAPDESAELACGLGLDGCAADRPAGEPPARRVAAVAPTVGGRSVDRLAACELVRVLAPRPGALSAALRMELHALVLSPGGGAVPDSAARVLVALGDATDVRILIDGLDDEDGSLRTRSTRALASARTLGARTRAAVALELEFALAGASDEGAAALRQALRALQTPEPAEPETLARVLLAPATSPEERLTSAEGLARASTGLASGPRRAARDLLVARAADGSPSERRRALYALGTLAEPDTLPTLTHAVRFDPDPAARSAGVRALRSFGARATLESVAVSDPSPEVRALATQELGAPSATAPRR